MLDRPLPEPPSPGWRLLKWVLIVFGAGVVLLLVGIGLLVWHFVSTPTFDEHVRTRPVAEQAFAADGTDGVVLSNGGAWRTGSVDPFALAEGDPRHARHGIELEVDLRRGDVTLLHLRQEVAVAEERSTGSRSGVAVRTRELSVGSGFRAVPRIYVHGLDDLLQTGKGSVTFDVVCGANSSASHSEVIALPMTELESFTVTEPSSASVLKSFLARLDPSGEVAPLGLLHRMRATCDLSWQDFGGSSQGAGLGEIRHAASTNEYSYEIHYRLTDSRDGGGHFSTALSWSNRFTWNGKLW